MKKLSLIVILVLSFASVFSQKKTKSIESKLKGIDTELNEVLETWKAAGFAVAVVEKNRVVYAKGFGFRDYENKIPATENTLFAIGSCTKSFTSAILGILENDDKLELTESPRKYIDLDFYNDEMNNQITITDMMSHRTGLPRHDYSWYFFPNEDKAKLLARVVHQEPFTGVRQRWYYNNFMFLAQGVIAEEITGKSWEDNISEKFFKPLGMSTSNATISAMKNSKEASFGYELKDDEIKKMDYYDISGMSPAGSINSSVNEMSNWVITWINGGKYKDKEVIPSSYATRAMSSQMIVAGGLPGEENPDLHMANYGFGWFTASYKGHYRVEHGGNIDGFSASTSFYPSDSVGIVVLANQNGSAVPSVVRNIISDRILNVQKTDWNKILKESRDKAIKTQKEAMAKGKSNKIAGTAPSHDLSDFSGNYSHPGYGTFEVSARGDSLFADFPLYKYWLRHYHYDIFDPFEIDEAEIDTAETSQLRFNFKTNNSGEITSVGVKIEQALDPIIFKREAIGIDVEEETLETYVGEYELAGITTKVFLKGDILFFSVPGQPDYELLPTGTHKFDFKTMEGFKLEFSENDKGDIAEVLVIQPHGNFTAVKK